MTISRKPTIADVARAAGVSKGLVSFVFNDRPGVAPQTRARILQAADDLGWRPSLSARSLSTRTSFALGLVVRRYAKVISSDPFFPAFIAGIELALAGESRVLVLCVVPDEDSEMRAYQNLVHDRRVDGVFLTDLRLGDRRLGVVANLGLPAVTVGHPEQPSEFPVVNLDDSAGIKAVVAHLVQLGHRHIAHVAGDMVMLHGIRRERCFREAMSSADLKPTKIIGTDFSVAAGARATAELLALRQPPTAIVYASDPMAIAGLGLLQERGLQVPSDMSITGFDGTEMARHVFPALTTVSSDPVAWGQAAATTLLTLIAEGRRVNVELPAAELIASASTGPPRPQRIVTNLSAPTLTVSGTH